MRPLPVCTCPSCVSNIFETQDGQVHTGSGLMSYVSRNEKQPHNVASETCLVDCILGLTLFLKIEVETL